MRKLATCRSIALIRPVYTKRQGMTWNVSFNACIICDQLKLQPIFEGPAWFIKKFKQFNQSNMANHVAALTMTLYVDWRLWLIYTAQHPRVILRPIPIKCVQKQWELASVSVHIHCNHFRASSINPIPLVQESVSAQISVSASVNTPLGRKGTRPVVIRDVSSIQYKENIHC